MIAWRGEHTPITPGKGFNVISLAAFDINRHQHQVSVSHRPDICPICHHAVALSDQLAVSINMEADRTLQVVHRCPLKACQRFFIANYHVHPLTGQYYLFSCVPIVHVAKKFSDIIQKTSAEFCEIYNQASSSESQGHLKICGVGYRKALEFLLKDYLISLHPEKAEEIKSRFLGKCIEDYVSNASIKAVAKRAVWLGNDETHYVRVWEGKDLQDLKKLVDLTVHWIEMEQLTDSVMKDMPD